MHFFFQRWPKWRPSAPSPRTPTTLDRVPKPTQPSRENWSLPNMAAGYSSGAGEAAPKSQPSSQRHGLCPKTSGLRATSDASATLQKVFNLLWCRRQEWACWFWHVFPRGFGQGLCPNGLLHRQTVWRKEDGWLCEQSPWIHLSWPLL